MFYTGLASQPLKHPQRICLATSPDPTSWQNHPGDPILLPDARWYAVPADTTSEVAWRDPWVLLDPGQRWHMLITAQAAGLGDDRGVVGHATSPDLLNWEATAPLSSGGNGFGHLEVPRWQRSTVGRC